MGPGGTRAPGRSGVMLILNGRIADARTSLAAYEADQARYAARAAEAITRPNPDGWTALDAAWDAIRAEAVAVYLRTALGNADADGGTDEAWVGQLPVLATWANAQLRTFPTGGFGSSDSARMNARAGAEAAAEVARAVEFALVGGRL